MSILYGHKTLRGRVVYKRKKHIMDVNDVVRTLYTVVNRYDVAHRPSVELLNELAPWKTIQDISMTVRKSQLAWLEYNDHPVRIYMADRMAINQDYYWFKDILAFCSYAFLNWDKFAKMVELVPYVGQVAAAGSLIFDILKNFINLDDIQDYIKWYEGQVKSGSKSERKKK
jgi:hypothetical protein